jgi:hypothetical protein
MHTDQGLAKEIEDEVEQLMGRVMSETHGILSHATATDDQGRDAMDRALLLVRTWAASSPQDWDSWCFLRSLSK